MSSPVASSTASVPWSEREPAAWLLRVGAWLQWLLSFVGVIALFTGGVAASRVFWDTPWPGFVLGSAAVYVAVAIHELGHLVGARATGMHVLRAHVGWLDFKAMRKGWKARWVAPALSVDGAVMAVAGSGRPLRVQEFWFVFGGPLANLVTALAAGLIAWATWRSGPAWMLTGFAAYSASLGLANLIPGKGPIANDGLQLWRLAKGKDETDPASVLSMINGLCIEGVTADQIPAHLLDRLQNQVNPPALVLLWFELFAKVHRGEWAAVVAMDPRIDEAIARLPEPERAGWSGLTMIMRTLSAIAGALETGVAVQPLDRHLSSDYDWFHPSLRLICRALESAMAGDAEARDRFLARAEFEAERSRDAASRKSQQVLRAAIRATLGERSAVILQPAVAEGRAMSTGGVAGPLLWGISCVLHVLVVGTGLLLLMIGSVFAAGMAVDSPLAGVALAILLALFGSSLHGLGRFLAARLFGMPIFEVGIGPFELLRTRKAWSLRWRRLGRWATNRLDVGLVPGRPERPALLALAMGGVALSGLTAVIFILLAMRGIPNAIGWFWLALAGHAAALSIGSLIPGPGQNNAGAQLLRVFRPTPAAALELASMRLHGTTACGVAPETWPEQTLASLRERPTPGALLALWLQLTSAIGRSDWAEADRAGAGLPAMMAAGRATQFDAQALKLHASIQAFWCLTKALRERRADAALIASINPELAWRLPWLRPLCLAMDAALRGDTAVRDRELARSQSRVADEADEYLRRVQGSLRLAIAAVAVEQAPETHAC